MKDDTFFTQPQTEWQRRYEALRTSFVERLPDKAVADRFGYSDGYFRLLKHQFRHGKIDLIEPVASEKIKQSSVTAEIRWKIKQWREHNLSAGEITELLYEDGVDLSVRTIERVLAEAGYPKLPRRTRLKIGRTVTNAEVPDKAETVSVREIAGQRFRCAGAGVFLFAPFVAQLGLDKVVRKAGLPGSKAISALNYLLSFLALKLLGTERYSHVGDHSFDPGLGLFSGLNVLPKCTAMSTYSYSIDEVHIQRLQEELVRQAIKLGLYKSSVFNLDFHNSPHNGDESVLEKHWAGARGKTMKGALTLFAQDAESKLILYTAADILREEANDQVLSFLSFWNQVQRGVVPTFVFDSKFTTYPKLSQLNEQGVRFITLRRRGKRLIEQARRLKDWTRIHIPNAKRKYAYPHVHESSVRLSNYSGEVRQVIIRDNGRENPTFLITNDFDSLVELIVGNYSRRVRVENGIAEAVKFFHLNALSSPILVKVHFDVAMTMVADTLYSMLAQKLRGFEKCNAQTIYRHFIRGKGVVTAKGGQVTVTYPRRAHNPILRAVPWKNLPLILLGLEGARINFRFQ